MARLRSLAILAVLGVLISMIPIAIQAQSRPAVNTIKADHVAQWMVVGGQMLMTCQDGVTMAQNHRQPDTDADEIFSAAERVFMNTYGTSFVYYCYAVPLAGLPIFNAGHLYYYVNGREYKLVEGPTNSQQLFDVHSFFIALPEARPSAVLELGIRGQSERLRLPAAPGRAR